jgi:undecaprenyl-diphosphatase
MNATVCCALAAFVLATALQSRDRVRARWYATAAAIALAVAFSRIYLGMHFPSDVLGGLVAGIAWVVLWMAVVQVARSRVGA